MKELPLRALIAVSPHPGRKQRIQRLEHAAHERAGVAEGGADGYLVTSFTAATLNEKLRNILSKHGLAA